MKKLSQVVWTENKIRIFLASVVLTRKELKVFDLIIRGIPYEEIAEECECSVGTINELNKVIKAKYRVAQLENPDVLEPLPE